MAVTANQLVKREDDTVLNNVPVAASTRIYAGTLVFEKSDGFADDDTGSGANNFLGISRDDVDNSSGSAGDLNVELWREGIFTLTGASFAQTSVGKPVFASDNYTLSLTGAGNSFVGIIEGYISSTKVRVRILPRTRLVGSADQAAVATTGATNSSPYGFTTAAQANALVAGYNAVRLALVNAGLLKGAA